MFLTLKADLTIRTLPSQWAAEKRSISTASNVRSIWKYWPESVTIGCVCGCWPSASFFPHIQTWSFKQTKFNLKKEKPSSQFAFLPLCLVSVVSTVYSGCVPADFHNSCISFLSGLSWTWWTLIWQAESLESFKSSECGAETSLMSTLWMIFEIRKH